MLMIVGKIAFAASSPVLACTLIALLPELGITSCMPAWNVMAAAAVSIALMQEIDLMNRANLSFSL
jgi:hypothetical protein